MDGNEGVSAESVPRVAGAQVVHRAAALLKQVACENTSGVRLQALCEQLGLDMSTAHRILRSLVAEGLITKVESSARYRLGPVAYELGLAATPPGRYPLAVFTIHEATGG